MATASERYEATTTTTNHINYSQLNLLFRTNNNNSSNTATTTTSKLTKAAMARRFLLRGRKSTSSTRLPNNEPSSTTNIISPTNSPRTNHPNNNNKNIKFRSRPTSLSKIVTPSSCSGGDGDGTDNMDIEVATCLLCYDEMDLFDSHIHPIICSSGCSFNCCTICTQTLLEATINNNNNNIQSTTTLSETIAAVEVMNVDASTTSTTTSTTSTTQCDVAKKIKCPNCRSDLSLTIYDTTLLRMVDRYDVDDREESRPTPPQQQSIQQQVKSVICDDEGIRYEIDMARKREVQFTQERHRQQQRSKQDRSYNNITSDVTNQDHRHCFTTDDDYRSIENTTSSSSLVYYDRNKLMDVTLLCGLENIMTWYQQETVTRYYTSNNTNQLCMAAKLLYDTRTKLQQQQQGGGGGSTERDLSVELNEAVAVATLYQLIEAGKRARYRLSVYQQRHNRQLSIDGGVSSESPSPIIAHRKRPEYYTKRSTQKATQFRKIEHEVRQQTAYMKRYPLPNRLPKYCECQIAIDCSSTDHHVSVSQIVKRLPFRFCNDQWDGSILDAYTKFIVQRCTTTYDPKKLLRGKNYSGINTTRQNITSIFVDNYKIHQRRPYDDINIQHILNIEKFSTNVFDESPTDDDSRDVCAGITTDTSDDDRVVDDVVVVQSQQQRRTSSSSSSSSSNSRVMIASIANMNVAGMIFPGDVVTHINGIELHDYTVDDIIALICSLCDSEATTTTTTTSTKSTTTSSSTRIRHETMDDTPPPPPPPITSSPIQQTLSLLDETLSLFTSTSSTSMDTDRSNRTVVSSSPKPATRYHQSFPPPPSPEQQSPTVGNNNNNNNKTQKVLRLQFVFNADIAVAKALQLRATAIRLQQ